MKKYDGLYIFAGNAKDDVLESSLTKAVAEIERFGGTVESQDILGKRTFARPMHKRENGVYAIIRFEIDPANVKELVNRYRLVEEVFRVQILAVDDRREAKLATQREAAERRAALKASKESEAAETAASAE